MDQAMVSPAGLGRAKYGVAAALVVGFLLAVVSWGGLPRGDRLPAFWLGVAALIGALLGFGLAFWYLLARPLPAGRAAQVRTVRTSHRQAMALLLGSANIMLVLGLFWDELWHRLYGIPFGEDFFWRPHLLMYFSFLAVSALGAASFFTIVLRMRGSLQQRFRAAPIFGLLVLVAAFMVYGLVADPLWHQIYGEDLSALSIPHVLLIMNFTATMLVTVAIQRSILPARAWSSPARLGVYDVLPLLMFAGMLLINLQVLMTDYDNFDSFIAPAVQARPRWVLSFLVAGVSSFVGVMACHSLRVYGAATIAGLGALGMRYGLIQLFDAETMRLSAWLVALPLLLAVDLCYGLAVLRGREPGWLGGALAVALGMLVAAPLLARHYPFVVDFDAPLVLAMATLAALGAGWLGAQVGDYLGLSNKQVEPGALGGVMRFGLVGTLVALATFILVFVTTAGPPV